MILYIYVCVCIKIHSSIAIQFVAAGIGSFDIWMYKLSERMYTIVCHCPSLSCICVWFSLDGESHGKSMQKPYRGSPLWSVDAA